MLFREMVKKIKWQFSDIDANFIQYICDRLFNEYDADEVFNMLNSAIIEDTKDYFIVNYINGKIDKFKKIQITIFELEV